MQKDIYVEIGAVEQLNKNIYWSVIIYKKNPLRKAPPTYSNLGMIWTHVEKTMYFE